MVEAIGWNYDAVNPRLLLSLSGFYLQCPALPRTMGKTSSPTCILPHADT
jgi:hypothetical protein